MCEATQCWPDKELSDLAICFIFKQLESAASEPKVLS